MQHPDAARQFELDLGDSGTPPASTTPKAASASSPEQLVERVFRALKPRTPLPAIQVDWRRYANANSSVRLESGLLHFRISDMLQSSPPDVLEALIWILLSKMYRKPVAKAHVHRYNLYINRRDVRRDMHLVRQVRGRKFISGPKGYVYDLAVVFDELNRRYFNGMMAAPELGWSKTRSRRLLGHFDPSHNAIIISRIFDSPVVKRLGLEFVMYHEMLHLRFPTQYRRARRCIHTPEFKKAEREFERWQEATELLKQL